jgi:hypothetical protein
MLAFVPMRFTFNLNLPDERGNGLNGVGYREEAGKRQARFCETRVNTLADCPDATFPVQSREGAYRIISHNIVELPHESLIGSENDCAYYTPMDWCLPLGRSRCRRTFPKARAQS